MAIQTGSGSKVFFKGEDISNYVLRLNVDLDPKCVRTLTVDFVIDRFDIDEDGNLIIHLQD